MSAASAMSAGRWPPPLVAVTPESAFSKLGLPQCAQWEAWKADPARSVLAAFRAGWTTRPEQPERLERLALPLKATGPSGPTGPTGSGSRR